MTAIPGTGEQRSRRVVVLVDAAMPGLPSLMRRLRRGGCTVWAARSADEIAERCGLGVVDLVILPMSRSGEPALSLLPVLADRHPDVAVIVFAAAPTTEQVAISLDHGVVGILTPDADRQDRVTLLERAWAERTLRRTTREIEQEARRVMERRQARDRRIDAALRSMQAQVEPMHRLRGDGGEVGRVRLVVDDDARITLEEARELALDAGRSAELERRAQQVLADCLAEHPRWSDVFVDGGAIDLLDVLLAEAAGPVEPHARRVIVDLSPGARRWEDEDLALGVERLRGRGYQFSATELELWGNRAARLLRLRPEFVRLSVEELRLCSEHDRRLQYLQTLVLAVQGVGAQVVVDGGARVDDARLASTVGCDMIVDASPVRGAWSADAGVARGVASC